MSDGELHIHCLKCKRDLSSFSEAAAHMLEGHLVESWRDGLKMPFYEYGRIV